MARLAYLMLCHQNPASIVRQAKLLTSQGDALAIHVDARAKRGVFEAVQQGIAGIGNVVLARRVACGWGEWSLVQATLNAVDAAIAAFPFTTHFYLLSGDCMPVKSAAHIHQHLDDNDIDYIESKDFHGSGWIKTGLKAERLEYRHWFNERKRKRLFYASMALQQRLGLRRSTPPGLDMRIGSQWWCLRRGTVEKLLGHIRGNRNIVRFFRSTWIPDETFFQTLVAHLVPRAEIRPNPPTFLMFSDYGMPVTFHSDHFEFLTRQDSLFARKISPRAATLQAGLADLFGSSEMAGATVSAGAGQAAFAISQGRSGKRFAPRFWEAGGSVGAGRLVNVVTCKKWHVALRLAGNLHDAGGAQCYGFVFDGDRPDLPPLGGYENDRGKRLRHRRAFLRLLAEHQQVDRLCICLDTSNVAALADIAGDDCVLHVLDIACEFDDDYIVGHADRIGMQCSAMPPDEQAGLVASLRRTFAEEATAIRKLGLPAMFRIRNGDAPGDIAEVLAAFAGVHPKRAEFLANDPTLFE